MAQLKSTLIQGDLSATGNAAIRGSLKATTIYEGETALTQKYQALDADLTAIADLTGTSGLLKKTGENTWVLDTSTYLTTHQSIKKLNTNNTQTQAVSESEDIAGSGTINLHKIAKTGAYGDLIGLPTIPNPANYYWANIKVSSTSSTATTPSVQKIGITGSTVTDATAAVTMEYDSGLKALKFVFA